MDRVEHMFPSGSNTRSEQPDQDERLETSSPTDRRSDEKVIANARRSNKRENKSSPTAITINEALGNDEKRLDGRYEK